MVSRGSECSCACGKIGLSPRPGTAASPPRAPALALARPLLCAEHGTAHRAPRAAHGIASRALHLEDPVINTPIFTIVLSRAPYGSNLARSAAAAAPAAADDASSPSMVWPDEVPDSDSEWSGH
eukprot:scaffold132045_cov72-Phaeocystis_antarctica.AAC.1